MPDRPRRPAPASKRWFATHTIGAPYLRHLLQAPDSDPPRPTRTALCGERRRHWAPVETFSRPDVFPECPRCRELAG